MPVQPESSVAPESSIQVDVASSQSSSETVDASHPFYEEELPMLVNSTNKIPDDYDPDVVDMGNGFNCGRKANTAYAAMLRKANADGVNLWVVSAYRSHEKQTINFNNKVQEYKNQGYSAKDAYNATAAIIAIPGYSEHSAGLAIDINSLYTSFEDTTEYAWLIENCADFGFVIRYPKDKVEITEISYEPWHYRYVGSNHAKIIMEEKICLEEYLSGDY